MEYGSYINESSPQLDNERETFLVHSPAPLLPTQETSRFWLSQVLVLPLPVKVLPSASLVKPDAPYPPVESSMLAAL